ncbi:MAG: RHS repeat-associated core domain-containing protein [Candidatus Kerfeldbacteria bacterium]|nr:RHS repeat-associated core domain-containing protein [Candidatus Kerfeldbacteria bacterium]
MGIYSFRRRISKTVNGVTTQYLYDGMNIIKEYDGTGALLATYTHGPGIDEPLSMTRAGQTYYYHADGLGSVTGLTDNSQTLVQMYGYDGFGNLDQPPFVQNPYTYTGREWDPETGLYYYRARSYEPKVGRFLQPDPIGLEGGINLYAYVGNNPANWGDPWGLMQLPGDPSGLPPNWTPDPSHQDPNGGKFADPSGRPLYWHPGQPGAPGWRGKDHWHDPNNSGKKHLPPGTDIPDPAPVPEPVPWWGIFRGLMPILILPGWECTVFPNSPGCSCGT